MSGHKATIEWRRGDTPFDYKSYPRDHLWRIADQQIAASAAPDYLGSESHVDPEQAYVAALSSCHMLTFLAMAAKRRFVVNDYVDEAVGYLEKNADGENAITRVVLKPKVSFEPGAAPDREALEKLHHEAHKHCFIASSVKTAIEVDF